MPVVYRDPSARHFNNLAIDRITRQALCAAITVQKSTKCTAVAHW